MRRAGCRFGDKRQRSRCDMCTMYVHGRVVPGTVAQSGKALARTSSDKRLATLIHIGCTSQNAEGITIAPTEV